ncbi:MAG: cold-active alkaline serine protease [Anaerolineaceae bacterium]|nr:MAG: cold-active alkaline serine protease [Anaerolineaceae bacterium]
MKRSAMLFSLVLVAVLVLGSVNISGAYAGSQNGKVRVLVQFAPGSKGAVEGALRGAGGEIHYAFDSLDAFAVTLPEAALNGISHNPNVILIEEDAPRYFISTPESSAEAVAALSPQTVPYGIDMVQARDVWDANRDGVIDTGAPTGSNRKICIIDSGMYTAHEDLAGVNVTGYNIGWNSDGLGHGSHVAGTIAAMNNALGVVGVTPGTVNLYIVKVFGDTGEWVYTSTLIDAANKCYAAGANIISMSLGGARSSVTERRGFDTLYANGVLSVAAASNDGTTAYSYPASYASVVSVAALDSNKQWATFSNYNDQVELAAPGVGVLSTVPYLDDNTLTVDGVTYVANHIEYSARGAVSGVLVDGGLCATSGAWAGKVVLCERGTYDFYTKVMSVQNGGGVAAVIYNNLPGNFLGTLGDGNSSIIPAISLTQEDGQYLVANKLGQIGAIESTYTWPASSYEYYDGTSMATPHVSAVAALIWSAKPTATNVEIRAALTATAEDLGAAGRDVYYGYGLVQAKDALDYLASGTTVAVYVADLDGTKVVGAKSWTATVTIKVVNANGVAVSGAVVTGAWSGAYTGTATCTTGVAGTCSVTTGAMKLNKTSVTYTVTNVAAAGYTYNAAANSDPDGDSTGTVITILK